MNIRFCLFVIILCTIFSADALNIKTNAGNLKEAIGENQNITNLVVSGQMDATDFEFIADYLKHLVILDISQVNIVAYSGEKLYINKNSSEPNKLPDFALAGTNITTINLPSTLVEIGEGAFLSTPLTHITIPESVTTIGMGAFINCTKLSTIDISNVSVINEYTFSQCRNLQNITISKALSKIKNHAFLGCTALQSFSFGDKLSLIGDNAFKFSGLTSINMSKCSNLKSIGDWAFAECYALTSVLLNDNTAKIGEGAFFNDTSLTELNIPTSCKQISDYMLKGAYNLNSTTITSATIDSIGAYALMGWDKSSTLTLPASVEFIGNNAFEDWFGLTKIHAENIKTNVPSLGDSVWQDLNRQDITLVVADNMVEDFRNMAQWQDFKIISGSDNIDNPHINSKVKIYFVGNDLIVEAGINMTSVEVYNCTGLRLATDFPNQFKHYINTSGWIDRFYILIVKFNDGTISSSKIYRQ